MTDWLLDYDAYDPAEEPLREALCTLGNGYFATRGAAEESQADGLHYPGNYLAGGYNRLETEVAGRMIENEDLVNMPNWLPLAFRPAGGDWLDLSRDEILSYRQTLDLRAGVLRSDIRVRDRAGRETSLAARRLVHMSEAHLAAIEWRIRPENWSGRIEVRSALDGRVVNSGVERYRQLNGKHLAPLETRQIGPNAVLLVTETNQSRLRVALAARTLVSVPAERALQQEPDHIAHTLGFEARQGEEVTVEKIVALFTSRDRTISEPALAAAQAVAAADDFEPLLERHALAWSHLWRRCDLVLEGRHRTQVALRLHIFHLLQTVSMHTVDLDVGVPARGLHGEAYRGHIFWDELFIFPFLNFNLPEVTRALLRYRYRRLPAARTLARQAGFAGAMYPWQSGSDGREESQVVHLNPRSGRWLPDHTYLQRHVNAGIAYNVVRDGAPESAGGEHVGFVHARQSLAASPCQLERQAHDAADFRLRVEHRIESLSATRAIMRFAALAEIDAAGELTHDHHVHAVDEVRAQRRRLLERWLDGDRAQVRKESQDLAYPQ